jgi:hypothetical protein
MFSKNDQNAETTIPRYCNNYPPMDQWGHIDILPGASFFKKNLKELLWPLKSKHSSHEKEHSIFTLGMKFAPKILQLD